jgi:hypothetical protein
LPYFCIATKENVGGYRQKLHLTGGLVHGLGNANCFIFLLVEIKFLSNMQHDFPGAYVYLTGEEFPTDSNLTIEVIQRLLKDIEKRRGKLPPTLYLQGQDLIESMSLNQCLSGTDFDLVTD